MPRIWVAYELYTEMLFHHYYNNGKFIMNFLMNYVDWKNKNKELFKVNVKKHLSRAGVRRFRNADA